MARVTRNAFNSGVLDPLLHSRTDLEQRRSALKTGTNVILLPHGGAMRRPGLRLVRALTGLGDPEFPGIIRRFRFNQETQYGLHFRDERLDVYQGDERITRIETLWANEDIPRIYARAQTADTMVVCSAPAAPTTDNATYQPRRLLRSALRSTDPIKTYNASPIVRVYHPDHGLLDHDKIGISGVRLDIALGTDPLEIVYAEDGVKLVKIKATLGADHGFTVAENVYFSGLLAIPVDTGYVADSLLNKRQKVLEADATTVTFSVKSYGTLAATGGGAAGIAYAKSLGGFNLETDVNSFHEVRTLESNRAVLDGDLRDVDEFLGADPCTVFGLFGGVTTVEVDMGANYGFVVGDRVRFTGFVGFSGIPASQLNRVQTITAAASDYVRFEADSGGTIPDTGGGSAGQWRAESFYEVEMGGNATSSDAGGGADARAWVLHSLAPNEARRVAFERLPQFDFEDSFSPAPKKEIQEVTFTGFLDGDQYILVIPLAPSSPITGQGSLGGGDGGIRTDFLLWSDVLENNATVMQTAINAYSVTGEELCTVELVPGDPGAPAIYRFSFAESEDYDPIRPGTIRSQEGQITQETVVEGGTTEEDVISDTRGWPAAALFYQRRLWIYAIASRPSTLLASSLEDFFNFKIGSALDSEAIDATGEFDTLRHLIGERGLLALTSGSEVTVGGGDNESITPGNINLQTVARYGSTGVPPVSVGGSPTYVDRTNRAIRQLAAGDGGGITSKEISIFSQHLIKSPVAMDVWRNQYGDYLFVINDDGTAAMLNINVDQGVAGWTEITTNGSFVDVAEVGDELQVIVERTVGGQTKYFLEAFDFAYHTDCTLSDEAIYSNGDIAEFGVGLRDDLPGYDHLEGETVQVRAGGGITLDEVPVTGGAIVPKNGGIIHRTLTIEAGLAIPVPTVVPMSPQVAQHSSISKASIDLFESRAVYVNGYRLRDYNPGQAASSSPSPLLTGLRPIQVRGWGDSVSITVTAPEPQPMLIRAIEMEVV